MLALHKFSCFHYTFSHFILSSDRFHVSQMLKFTKPCSPRSGVRLSVDLFSACRSSTFHWAQEGWEMGQVALAVPVRNGRAAGNLVPALNFWELVDLIRRGSSVGAETSRTHTWYSICTYVPSVYRDSRVQEVRIGMDTYFKIKVRETKLLYKCMEGVLLTLSLA